MNAGAGLETVSGVEAVELGHPAERQGDGLELQHRQQQAIGRLPFGVDPSRYA